MFRHLVLAFATATLFSAFGAKPVHAHDGHDHGQQTPAAPASAAPRGEAHSDKFELVAVVQGNALLFYIDDFVTNEPLEQATVEVETPDGPATAKPLSGGVYRLDAPFLDKGGHIDLIVTVSRGDDTEILPLTLDIPAAQAAIPGMTGLAKFIPASWAALLSPSAMLMLAAGFLLGALFVSILRPRRRTSAAALIVGLIVIHAAPALSDEGHKHEEPAQAAATEERAHRLPDGSVFVPKPIQRIYGIRTAQTQAGTFRRSVEMPGRIIPDPNFSGHVQTAVGGMLSPPPGGFPRLGTQVKQGDILAFVTSPLQAIDVSDMRQKQGELDQQISIVQRRLVRLESLATTGSVARSQLEETKLELDGLRDRRAALETARREPVALVAPVSGVIADGNPITGQIAQSSAIVFQIVRPEKLWIEALSFDAIAGSGDASAKTGNGKSLALTFRGSGLADRSQSIPVHFSIEGDATGLRAGQFVTVYSQTGEERQGISVPRTAVVRASNGQDFVFEHTSAERFEPRPVRVDPLDAQSVIVAAGIEPGKRIVVQGAELLNQVR